MNISIASAILQGAQVLREGGISEARREAGSLLAHTLGKDRTFLISHPEDLLNERDLKCFTDYVQRRGAREPLQYIIGTQDFFGLEFKVTPDVLIPRPETELLVERALELMVGADAAQLICDVGTGSGCIAVTLLHERPLAHAVALDISPAAIRVAQKNASLHSVTDRISFAVSDCFQSLTAGAPLFDLIVSNPPYVSEASMEGLQREVRDHEPRIALTPGEDGLVIVRRLISEAPNFLKQGAYLLFEIGFDQAAAVERLIDSAVWKLLGIHPDLQGIPRIVVLQKLGSINSL